ncbi:hypothetical protein Mapa_002222 [Marchantia paleacea]|nr:hypothetical protein Mapa_002222 [Marchantia paleacea]
MMRTDAPSPKMAEPTKLSRCSSLGARKVTQVSSLTTVSTRAPLLFSARSLATRRTVAPPKHPCWYSIVRFTLGFKPRSLVRVRSAPGMFTPLVVAKTTWVIWSLGWPHSAKASMAAFSANLGTSLMAMSCRTSSEGSRYVHIEGLAFRMSSVQWKYLVLIPEFLPEYKQTHG